MVCERTLKTKLTSYEGGKAQQADIVFATVWAQVRAPTIHSKQETLGCHFFLDDLYAIGT